MHSMVVKDACRKDGTIKIKAYKHAARMRCGVRTYVLARVRNQEFGFHDGGCGHGAALMSSSTHAMLSMQRHAINKSPATHSTFLTLSDCA